MNKSLELNFRPILYDSVVFLRLQTQKVYLKQNIRYVPQKTCDYIFCNKFNNRCPITIIFDTVSSKSMRHRKMVSFLTSPT